MVAPLSQDLRQRVVAAYASGVGTYEEIAEIFGVGRASVSRLLTRARRQEGLEPKPHGGGTPPRIPPTDHDALAAVVREKPDATLAELCAQWSKETGVNVSVTTMGRALHGIGFTWKKNASGRQKGSGTRCRSSEPSTRRS